MRRYEFEKPIPIDRGSRLRKLIHEEFICRAENDYKAYYKPKDIVNPKESFAFMEQLIPKKENAFLLRRE